MQAVFFGARRLLFSAASFPNAGSLPGLAAISLCLSFILAAPAVAAKGAVVIRNDRGGSVAERIEQIREYRRAGTKIEIRGDYCLSSCTLFLGVPGTCVSRATEFGFHGPSSRKYGIALPRQSFERWSTAMAELYPEPLRTWFMQTARNRIIGFYALSGADLIRMGFRPCDTVDP